MSSREMAKFMGNLFIFGHQCNLPSKSDSCLTELPPYASRTKKLWRKFQKYTIMDKKSAMCKKYFRSNASAIAERKRHAKEKKFIIHPFSTIAKYRRSFRCISFIISYFLDPFIIAFQASFMFFDLWFYIQAVMDVFHLSFIISEFFVGIHKPFTRDIVLDRNYKVKWYLKTYFFLDFIPCFPYKYVIHKIWDPDPMTSRLMFIGALKCLRLTRLSSMMIFLQESFESMTISQSFSILLRLILLLSFTIYWLSCFVYVTPIIYYTLAELPENSWLLVANIHPMSNSSVVFRCSKTILVTVSHFYGAGESLYAIKDTMEILVFSFTIIFGYCFCIFLIAKVLQTFGSNMISECKYDEFLYQIKEYVKAKKLPDNLKRRLLNYYQYKFQYRFFKEEALLNTLSEHLRHEIFLFSCRNIIEKVPLFQSMSKASIGGIIGQLTREVYLKNDVILKCGDPVLDLHFVVHGTVALYLPNGIEVLHIEDGMHFGEVDILDGTPSYLTVVAIEITEILSLNKRFLKGKDDEIVGEIRKVAIAKKRLIFGMEHYSTYLQTRDVLVDLRRGKILEMSKKRKHNT